MVECNRDCLNCPYPDAPEECLEAPLSLDDYRELDWLDREIIRPKTERQKKASAKQKAYREANREEIAAKQKAIADVRRARRMTQSGRADACQHRGTSCVLCCLNWSSTGQVKTPLTGRQSTISGKQTHCHYNKSTGKSKEAFSYD